MNLQRPFSQLADFTCLQPSCRAPLILTATLALLDNTDQKWIYAELGTTSVVR